MSTIKFARSMMMAGAVAMLATGAMTAAADAKSRGNHRSGIKVSVNVGQFTKHHRNFNFDHKFVGYSYGYGCGYWKSGKWFPCSTSISLY